MACILVESGWTPIPSMMCPKNFALPVENSHLSELRVTPTLHSRLKIAIPHIPISSLAWHLRLGLGFLSERELTEQVVASYHGIISSTST